MKAFFSALCLLLASITAAHAEAPPNPHVLLKTSMGDIVLELDADKAPVTVKNFLDYVMNEYYDGTVFHRVIPQFMIQGGGFTKNFQRKPTRPPIKNEAANGLKNLRGTIAMARTSDPDSATSQFFINVVDNPFLDHDAPPRHDTGYAVFGKVIKGMDVVDRIAALTTGAGGPFPRNVPQPLVVIERAVLLPNPAGK